MYKHKKLLAVIVFLCTIFLAMLIQRLSLVSQIAPGKIEPTAPQKKAKFSPLQQSAIGDAFDTTLESSDQFLKKETLEDNRTKYVFKSPIPERPKTIVTEENVVVYESVLNPEDSQVAGYLTLTNIQNLYGEPDETVGGSELYGEHMVTHIYASRGFTVIANPFTEEVYETQIYTPMTADEFKRQYGDDIPVEPFDEEILPGFQSEQEEVLKETPETKGVSTSAYREGEKRLLNHPTEAFYDTLCLFFQILCFKSDIDNTQTSAVPTPKPPDPPPAIEITPTPGSGLTYDIPIKDTSVLPKPKAEYADWEARLKASFPKAKFDYYENYLLPFAQREGLNPAFLLTLWTEETGASTTTIVSAGGSGLGKSKEHIGCNPSQVQYIVENLQCLKRFMTRWNIQGFEDFARAYCGPNVDPICANNENFLNNIAYWYDQYVPPGTHGARTPY